MASLERSRSANLRSQVSQLTNDEQVFEKKSSTNKLSRSKLERKNNPQLSKSGSKSLKYYSSRASRDDGTPVEYVDSKTSTEVLVRNLKNDVEFLSPSTLPSRREKPNPMEVTKLHLKKLVGTEEELGDPLPPLEGALDDSDLRESSYELLIGAMGARSELKRTSSIATSKGEQAPVSVFARAFSLRKASDTTEEEAVPSKSPLEIILHQLKLSTQFDERTRKGLSQASGSQFGKRHDNLISPLELLYYLGPLDFPNHRDYLRWRRRQLSLIEQGLIYSPLSKSDGQDSATKSLKMVLEKVRSGQLDLADGQQKLSFRVAVLTKAESPSCGRGAIRWANGYPFNVQLYQSLLKAVFNHEKPSEIIEEVEEVLETMQKAWPVLGMTKILHHITFAFVLFQQFVSTGQMDETLASASCAQVEEAIRIFKNPEEGSDAVSEEQREMEKQAFRDYLGALQAYAEKRLFAYQETFPVGARGVMEHLVGIALYAEDILQSEEIQGYQSKARKRRAAPAQDKAELYIRSSIKSSFAMIHEMVTSQRRSSKGREGLAPVLVSLAVEAGELAEREVALYAPAFKEWCQCSGGVAAATVHSLFATELKQFVRETKLLTQEAAQVLLAADRLEKQLVQMAVEDGEESEDGGASAIRQMPPFETEAGMQRLLTQWVDDRLAKFAEWVERTVEKEDWDPSLLPEHHAPSAVDVSQLLKETLDAFFELPLPPSGEVLVKLARGMEAALQIYGERVVDGIGPKDAFLPSIPALTRYKRDLFVKAQQALQQPSREYRRPGPGGGGGALPKTPPPSQLPPVPKSPEDSGRDPISLHRLCCRINTLYFVISDLDQLMAQIRKKWEATLAPPSPGPGSSKGVRVQGIRAFFSTPKAVEQVMTVAPPLPSEMIDLFGELKERLGKNIDTLAEYAAYKIVFKDMKPIVTDGLYLGGVSTKTRINIVIEALRPYLISIVDNIRPEARDKLVVELLRALCSAVVRVLLAGGPCRAYTVADARQLEQDFQELREFFIDGGEGLPKTEVDKATQLWSQILYLFSCETDVLLKSFDAAYAEWLKSSQDVPGKDGKLKIPTIMGRWNPNPKDPNTLLRVLCYRADRRGSKHLKKLFDFPKELRR